MPLVENMPTLEASACEGCRATWKLTPGATELYVVHTSNMFAILGLRWLLFARSAMIHWFAYMKFARLLKRRLLIALEGPPAP